MQVTDGTIAVYFSTLGAKRDLIFESNDDRITKATLDTFVVTGGFKGSGTMHVRGVQSSPTENDPEFCIEVHSSPRKCNEYRTGSSIFLYHNNVKKATIPAMFEQFKFCLPLNYVDIENDVFKMHIRGPDGVST